MRRLFILSPAIAVLVLIISCKDDTVSTNSGNTPADSLLFTKDSIYSGPLGFWGEANYIIRDTTIKKVRATYTCVTNDETDSIVGSLFTVSSDSIYSIHKWGYLNNDNFEYTFPVYLNVQDSATVRFAVNAPLTSNKYIIMKNIKLYKTH